MKLEPIVELSNRDRELVEAASEVLEQAYAPYSNYQVGAAIRSNDGEIICGANVENVSFGLTICAERSALVSANAQGKREIESVAIVARNRLGEYSSNPAPCGACRQFIFEFASISGRDIRLLLVDKGNAQVQLTSIHELLPLGFGPSELRAEKPLANRYSEIS